MSFHTPGRVFKISLVTNSFATQFKCGHKRLQTQRLTRPTHKERVTHGGTYFLGPGPGVAGTAFEAAEVSFDTTRVRARFSDFSFSFSDLSFCNCCEDGWCLLYPVAVIEKPEDQRPIFGHYDITFSGVFVTSTLYLSYREYSDVCRLSSFQH